MGVLENLHPCPSFARKTNSRWAAVADAGSLRQESDLVGSEHLPATDEQAVKAGNPSTVDWTSPWWSRIPPEMSSHRASMSWLLFYYSLHYQQLSSIHDLGTPLATHKDRKDRQT